MLINPDDLKPGDVGLGPIFGPGGWIPKLGQLIVEGRSWPEHAFLIVGYTSAGSIVQAMPRGAEIRKLNPARDFTTEHIFYRPPYAGQEARWRTVERAYHLARALTPYSFLDYASLALWHWKVRPNWVAQYITSTGHMICSQLVDDCLTAGDVHPYDDGRLHQDVTPAGLSRQLSLMDGCEMMIPRRLPSVDKVTGWE